MPSYDVKSGDQSVLAQKINTTQTTGIIAAAMNINGELVAWANQGGGVAEISEQSDSTLKREWFYYTGGTENDDGSFTFSGVVRGLGRDTSDTTSGSTGQSFSKGAVIRFVTFHDLLNKKADTDRADTITAVWTFGTGGKIAFSGTNTEGLVVKSLTEAQRDALTPANGAVIYNTTTGLINYREGGAWVANSTGGSVADASDTVAGKVEIATQAEIRAETTLGATGARLVVPADSGSILKDDRIVLKDATELTIATGAITVTQPYHKVDTESDAAGDDLITITAAVGAGEIIYLRLENSARIVNIKDGDGNIVIPGGDYTLTDPDEVLTFLNNGTNWLFIGARNVPVGTIQAWTTDTAPTGWSLLAGGTLSRTTYSNLYDRIGTTWGTGDGSTTFTLPDTRGRFLLGQDDMTGSAANRVTATTADNLGQAAGVESISIAHTHTMTRDPDTLTSNSGGAPFGEGDQQTGGMSANSSPNIMNPYLTMNFIIKL